MRDKYELSPAEKWEQATLANNFLFYKVMRHHPDACKCMLELLLGIEIERLELAAEEAIDIDHDSKGVRLDVYAKDSSRVFDIEVQVADTKELAERARYYQGIMDIDSLKSGQPYSDLKDSYVLFICMSDIFGKGLPIYSFENLCREDKTLSLDDRSYKYFFIAPTCARILADAEQQAFFELLTANKASSPFTDKLKGYIEDAKQNTQWRVQYMTWERQQAYAFNNGKEEGIAIGLAEGEARGRTEGSRAKALEAARNFLSMHLSAEQVAQGTGLTLAEVQQLAAESAQQ